MRCVNTLVFFLYGLISLALTLLLGNLFPRLVGVVCLRETSHDPHKTGYDSSLGDSLRGETEPHAIASRPMLIAQHHRELNSYERRDLDTS